MPAFICHYAQSSRPLAHVWEHAVGSCHAPVALRADWQTQLKRCHDELGVQRVRFHALLSDQLGILMRQNEQLLYAFFNADQIMDFLLSIGMRPFVELSFMPEALASGHTTVFRYRANVTPPRDYTQWATLIQRLVGHWVARYGTREVSEWRFEVWNEPNLEVFWTGGRDGYLTLYRHTAETIKGVDASLKVGGPATAQNAWIPEFLDFCEHHHVPADFVSTHYYPTDAFGQIGADTDSQRAHTPRHVMRDRAEQAHRQARGRPLYYTEWNISSNPRDPMRDRAFAAAFATTIVMSVHDVVDGYSFWTFTDIFEEDWMPSIPFHGGFGLLTLHGIAKPVYRAFELLHRLGTELLSVEGTHETVSAWAIRKETAVTVLLTNHAMPRHPIKAERLHVQLRDAPEPRTAYLERIDDDHANPQQLWREMGEPEYLSSRQIEQLHAASGLVKEPLACQYTEGSIHLDLDLPPYSVAAITVELSPRQPESARDERR